MDTPGLTQAHTEIRALAREFARAEILPNAADWNARHHVPMDTLRAMGELGFLGVIVPEEHGGTGLDYTSLALIIEEVSVADAGTAVGIAAQNSLGAAPIVRFGTDAQKSRYLPELAAGERFIADRGPGFTVGREIPKLGLYTSSTVELAATPRSRRSTKAPARSSAW